MTRETFILSYQITSGTELFFSSIFMAALFRPFLREGNNPERLRRNLFLIILVNGAGCLLYLLPSFSGKIHMVTVTLTLMALSGFLGMERNFIFLLEAVFYSVRNLSMIMMRSVDYFLEKIFLKNTNTAELVYWKAFWNNLLVTAMQLLLFSIMLFMAGRQLRKREMRLHVRELCCLLLAPAMGILFVNLVLRLLVVVNGNEVFRLFESIPAFTVILPAMAFLIYAGILAAIAACQRILLLQEERENYFVATQQLSAMANRIREAEGMQDDLRRMKHELRNHLTTIRGLAVSGHYEDMDAYIGQMNKSLDMFSPAISTGNPVTDVILNDKRKSAMENGIHFQTEFTYPEKGGYNAYDMGIILGNLLQNALEACGKVPEGSRYISVSGRQKKKFFLLEVRNSFQGEIHFDRHTNLPLSTKEEERPGTSGLSRGTGLSDVNSGLSHGNGMSGMNSGFPHGTGMPGMNSGFSHGIGLSNVKRTAEKYSGNLDIRIEGNTFCVTVLLQQCSLEKQVPEQKGGRRTPLNQTCGSKKQMNHGKEKHVN